MHIIYLDLPKFIIFWTIWISYLFVLFERFGGKLNVSNKNWTAMWPPTCLTCQEQLFLSSLLSILKTSSVCRMKLHELEMILPKNLLQSSQGLIQTSMGWPAYPADSTNKILITPGRTALSDLSGNERWANQKIEDERHNKCGKKNQLNQVTTGIKGNCRVHVNGHVHSKVVLWPELIKFHASRSASRS